MNKGCTRGRFTPHAIAWAKSLLTEMSYRNIREMLYPDTVTYTWKEFEEDRDVEHSTTPPEWATPEDAPPRSPPLVRTTNCILCGKLTFMPAWMKKTSDRGSLCVKCNVEISTAGPLRWFKKSLEEAKKIHRGCWLYPICGGNGGSIQRLCLNHVRREKKFHFFETDLAPRGLKFSNLGRLRRVGSCWFLCRRHRRWLIKPVATLRAEGRARNLLRGTALFDTWWSQKWDLSDS